MSRELHNLEMNIKRGKYPSEIYKTILVSLTRSIIFLKM